MILSSLFDTIQAMPLDRCKISTSFPIQSSAVTDTATFRKTSGLELRDFNPSSKFIKGEEIQYGKLHIGTYDGLSIYVQRSATGYWKAKSIHFNPGKLLHGHNGRSLNETECLIALSILLELLTPLLAHSNDLIHLLPGIAPDSRALWSLLEIPINLHDPDGHLQFAFRNPSHAAIKKAAWRADGESVKLAARRGEVKINFYRKDREMVDLLKHYHVTEVPRILRVEVTLTAKKLLHAFQGDGCIESLNGMQRLVRFTGPDLIAAFRSIISNLQGCYNHQPDEAGTSGDGKFGRFMAHVSHVSPLSVDDQISIYERRFGLSDSTRTRLRTAAKDELSRLSMFSCDDAFSDDAFSKQASIVIPRLERFMQPRRENTHVHPLVLAAYGSSNNPATSL